MRHLSMGLAAALLLGVSAQAEAPKKLFIKTKDAKLLQKPDPKSKVLGTMAPGTEVDWGGRDQGNPMFHQVTAKKHTGYTLQQNLSPNAPKMELVSDDGRRIDAQAFASSGAATKALSEAALKYSAEAPNTLELTKGVLTAEGIAQTVKPADAQAYIVKQTGGGK